MSVIVKDQAKISVDIIGLSKSKVRDENGQETTMMKIWQQKPTVFVFLRHFACIGCRYHAETVWARREEFEKKGSRVVFIGNGMPDFIKKFRQDMKLGDALIFTDPTLLTFRAAGFKRGFLSALGPRSIRDMAKLKMQGGSADGVGLRANAGDVWQMGGVLIVKTDGRIIYQYISEAIGDFPPEKDLVSEAGAAAQDATAVSL